ncbi:DUF975 family protein [Treponema sp.]|uniref:DUF975 family protein n=1 Tax=Treponema sp. TaxID=166 RepID=UPI003F0D579E
MFESARYSTQARVQLKGRMKVPAASFMLTLAATVLAARNLTDDSGLVRFLAAVFTISVFIFSFLRIFIHIHNENRKADFSVFVNSFNFFIKAFAAGLYFLLWVVLWSMLFFFPGIIKAVSYSQMFFVLAENPRISVCKAMNISKILMRGHKADIFMMALKFVPWEILSVFTFFIIQIWIKPYELMSFTNAYYALKEEAFRTGVLTPADFEA